MAREIEKKVLSVFSIFEGGTSRIFGKDLPKVIFRVKAHESADCGNRIVGIFQIFDGDVDADRIQKLDGGLPKLPLTEMIEGRFADATVPCQIRDRKALVPAVGEIFHSALQGIIKGNIALLHLGKDGAKQPIKAGIGFEKLGFISREQCRDLQNVVLCLLGDVQTLGLIFEALVVQKAA